MLIKLTLQGGKLDVMEVDEVSFSAIPVTKAASATEKDLEDLIAANVNLIETSTADDDGDTLLIIGRQVVTDTGKRMDLVALDKTGALILIEVKRDAKDMQYRKDHGEIQAVRYAASLAKLKTAEHLVKALYAPYIRNFQPELLLDRGVRSPEEWALKKINDFVNDNGIEISRLNHKQEIVLVGAGFDPDTRSAAAWMAANGLPIRVIEVRPHKVGTDYFLDIVQIIPVATYENLYVSLTPDDPSVPVSKSSDRQITRRQQHIRLAEMLKAGTIKAGDSLWFSKDSSNRVTLTADGRCIYNGKEVSLIDWTRSVSGWSAVNIYDWVVHGPTNKLLGVLRTELEAELAAKQKTEG
jgi:hypothetical protein